MNKFWQVHPTRMNLLSLVNRSAIKSLHLHTSVAASARSLSAAAHPGRFNVDLQAVNDDHSSKNKSLQFCSAPFVPTSSMASVQHFTSVTSNRKFSTSSSTNGQGQGQGEGRGEGRGEGAGGKPRDDQLPPLMDHPYVPSDPYGPYVTMYKEYVNMKKNEKYIMSQLDPKFSLEEFKQGAESTFLTVSNILGSNDISTLKDDGLIDSKAFNEIQFNLDKFTQKQRLIFRTSKELLRGTNVHQIGIIEESGLKAVEIMVVFTVMPFSAEEFSVKEMTPMELMRNVVLCNYQFYRDYTDKDNPSDWIINVVNHFYPLPPPST